MYVLSCCLDQAWHFEMSLYAKGKCDGYFMIKIKDNEKCFILEDRDQAVSAGIIQTISLVQCEDPPHYRNRHTGEDDGFDILTKKWRWTRLAFLSGWKVEQSMSKQPAF